jgi:hypothetical protein
MSFFKNNRRISVVGLLNNIQPAKLWHARPVRCYKQWCGGNREVGAVKEAADGERWQFWCGQDNFLLVSNGNQ